MGTSKHLVVGSSGQVGSHLLARLMARGGNALGTYHRHPRQDLTALDVTDEAKVRAVLQEAAPHVVWMPAAMPDVDRCEREPELSWRLNVEAVRRLAVAANDIGAKFVFYSTDYVFDGRRGPYRESDTPHPLQVYGRHKWESEEWLLGHIPQVLIVRTAWVYSQEENPKNFVYRIRQQLSSGQPLKAATDQISTPTAAGELADRSIRAVDGGLDGILHLVGNARLSRYAWTTALAEQYGYRASVVQPILTHELELAAQRPLDGGLVTEREG